MEDFQRKFTTLPLEFQKKVLEYIDFLEYQGKNKKKQKLGFSWAGGLKELKEKYGSVELQHQILNLWSSEK